MALRRCLPPALTDCSPIVPPLCPAVFPPLCVSVCTQLMFLMLIVGVVFNVVKGALGGSGSNRNKNQDW